MKNSNIIILMGLAVSLHVSGQTTEEAEWLDARQALADNPSNTLPVELFIQRHPTSSRLGEATLALEQAEILTKGYFDISRFNYVSVPQLSQLRPSEQALQYFVDNQNDMYLLHQGVSDEKAKALRATVRNRCNRILESDNAGWNDEAEYTLGYLDYLEGNLESALRHWEGLPDEKKYDATLPFYRSQILMAQGRWDEARQTISRLEGNPELTQEQRLEMTRIEGECLLHGGNTARAASLLETYITRSREKDILPTSAYNCALLAYRNGNTELCNRAAEIAIRNSKGDDRTLQNAQMLLGQNQLRCGNHEAARMAFEQAALLDADAETKEAAAYNRIAAVHQNAYTPFGDEVTLMEEFLNTYPNSRYADQVSEYLSEVYMTSRNYETALQSVRKIRKPNARVLKAKQRLLYQLGAQDYVNGKYRQAEQELTECLSLGSYPEAWFWRGEARYHQQDFRGAEQDWAQFLQERDTKFELRQLAQYDLGYARFRQNNFSGAATAFSNYIGDIASRGTENYIDAMTRLGDCYYYQRDFAKAESYYHTARITSPKAKGADWNLFQEAFMMGLQKKYNDKVFALSQMEKDYPESDWCDDAWLETGKTHILQERNGDAINALLEVINRFPDGNCAPQAAIQLAMVYNNQGQQQAAMKSYKQVIGKWPHSDEAKMALEDLKVLYTDQNDVRGYDQYLASVSGGQGLTGSERDSLNMVSAARLASQGNIAKAYETYQQVLAETTDESLRREVLPIALSQAYNLEKYADVTACWEEMRKMQGLNALTIGESQLMAAKAYQAQGNTEEATQTLTGLAADIRTAPGAEAKYLLAQQAYDREDPATAKTLATEMMRQGTPHSYWLARSIILLSDVLAGEDNAFQAEAYLKSLKANYKADDDIQDMIDTRLNNKQQ